MPHLRSYLSAFRKITNWDAQDIKSSIYFVFQLLKINKNWKCSIYDFVSKITKKPYDIIPLLKTVPNGPFRRRFSALCFDWA